MKVLITGCPGFLGSSVYSALQRAGINQNDIYTMSRSETIQNPFNHYIFDLGKDKLLNWILDEVGPDVIFHLAGNANTKIDEEEPNDLIESNIIGTHNLLRAIQKTHKKPRLVFASSVTVYGEFFQRPTTCDWNEDPISVYATTKLAAENLIHTYYKQGVIDAMSIRIPALVGVGSTHGLLHDLFKKVSSDDPVLRLIGTAPGSKKPFVHVDEAADFFVKVSFSERTYTYPYVGDNFILAGNRDNLTVEDIANLVMEKLGKKKPIVWNGQTWPGDNSLINIDPTKTFPSNSRQAIEKVVDEWLASQRG